MTDYKTRMKNNKTTESTYKSTTNIKYTPSRITRQLHLLLNTSKKIINRIVFLTLVPIAQLQATRSQSTMLKGSKFRRTNISLLKKPAKSKAPSILSASCVKLPNVSGNTRSKEDKITRLLKVRAAFLTRKVIQHCERYVPFSTESKSTSFAKLMPRKHLPAHRSPLDFMNKILKEGSGSNETTFKHCATQVEIPKQSMSVIINLRLENNAAMKTHSRRKGVYTYTATPRHKANEARKTMHWYPFNKPLFSNTKVLQATSHSGESENKMKMRHNKNESFG
eukprot:TRINITY_DN9407_c0_g2_i3.p1 TRINITY_DN9407_c0_g2~~TRINITY_DN9407_c0_g2_i3.p1  ORF type:complete len:280 (+),score=33.62 TRINITY_DN9407_c0_g2_i3:329-1168(+)